MHVCLFDIDGTLLNSGGAGRAAMETALCQVFGLKELRGRVAFSGRTDRAIVRDLFALHEITDAPVVWNHFVSAYLRLLPECLQRHDGRVLPGIAALLERLGQRNDVVVGLLTGNLREGARLKLGHYGLYDHFAFGGFGDKHLTRDEVAQEAFRLAPEHLNGSLQNDRVWVIGDTPLDIQCARCIGAKAVAVATGFHSMEELAAEKPDLLLNDFSDPTPLLASCGCV
jgi:phosphoglycolate phosphatase